jgi:hypothetical protein
LWILGFFLRFLKAVICVLIGMALNLYIFSMYRIIYTHW